MRSAIRRLPSRRAASKASRCASPRRLPIMRARRRSWRRRRHACGRCSASSCSGATSRRMESVVIDLLRERELTLAVAESVSGGLAAYPPQRRAGHARRVPGRRGRLRERGQVRRCWACPAGRWSARWRRARWPRASAGCSAPTSASRPPASPAPRSRTVSPWARCSSASRSATRPRPRRCACPATRIASGSTR